MRPSSAFSIGRAKGVGARSMGRLMNAKKMVPYLLKYVADTSRFTRKEEATQGEHVETIQGGEDG